MRAAADPRRPVTLDVNQRASQQPQIPEGEVRADQRLFGGRGRPRVKPLLGKARGDPAVRGSEDALHQLVEDGDPG